MSSDNGRHKDFFYNNNVSFIAGRVQVHLSDLPSGQEDDRWHQLMLGSARTARGSIRFGALFKDYVILPVEEYSDLKEVGFD